MLYLFHPVFCILGSFLIIFHPYVRQNIQYRKNIMSTMCKTEIMDCLTIVDKHSKLMPDVVYMEICDALQAVYVAIENMS